MIMNDTNHSHRNKRRPRTYLNSSFIINQNQMNKQITLTIFGKENMKQKKNKYNDDLDDGNNNGYFKEIAVFLSLLKRLFHKER